MNIKFEYINKLFYKMINLFISGSDSGKAQDGSCKLKFIKLNLPEIMKIQMIITNYLNQLKLNQDIAVLY